MRRGNRAVPTRPRKAVGSKVKEAAPVKMTEVDILRELAAAMVPEVGEGEGLLMSEIRDALNVGDDRARAIVRAAIGAGKIRPSKRRITGIDGKQLRVSSYVIIDK